MMINQQTMILHLHFAVWLCCDLGRIYNIHDLKIDGRQHSAGKGSSPESGPNPRHLDLLERGKPLLAGSIRQHP